MTELFDSLKMDKDLDKSGNLKQAIKDVTAKRLVVISVAVNLD